jgi:cytochrome c oxidase subunit 2
LPISEDFAARQSHRAVAIGHQFWWEYRYPGPHVVTANELHVPVSDPLPPNADFYKVAVS